MIMEAPPRECGRPSHGQYAQLHDRTRRLEVVGNEGIVHVALQARPGFRC